MWAFFWDTVYSLLRLAITNTSCSAVSLRWLSYLLRTRWPTAKLLCKHVTLTSCVSRATRLPLLCICSHQRLTLCCTDAKSKAQSRPSLKWLTSPMPSRGTDISTGLAVCQLHKFSLYDPTLHNAALLMYASRHWDDRLKEKHTATRCSSADAVLLPVQTFLFAHQSQFNW